jgi:tRNA(fMet)-specific endonuclease VapC
MNRFLLDTNVISAAIRNPGGAIDEALRSRSGEEIGTSLIVKGEILFGLKKNANVRGRERLEVFLEAMTVWPLEDPVGDFYGEIRTWAERQGQAMGANDLWIAAQALALEATVVTDDKAFSRVPGLKVENWLRA